MENRDHNYEVLKNYFSMYGQAVILSFRQIRGMKISCLIQYRKNQNL